MSIPRSIPKKLAERIEFWDTDEPGVYIVTLHYGWSFESGCHEGVRGFDTIEEAKAGIRFASPCKCAECEDATTPQLSPR